MCTTNRVAHALGVLLVLVLSLSSFDAFGSPRGDEAADVRKVQEAALHLKRLGYQLTEQNLKRALQDRDIEASQSCLDYAVGNGFTGLVPTIREWRDSLELKLYYQLCRWFRFTAAIYALDENISKDELANEITEIRKAIFQKKVRSVPISAYIALLAANEYQGVNIEGDLRNLAKTTIMGSTVDRVIRELFDRYGDRQNRDTVEELLAAWSDSPDKQALITRCAAMTGIVLVETETPR